MLHLKTILVFNIYYYLLLLFSPLRLTKGRGFLDNSTAKAGFLFLLFDILSHLFLCINTCPPSSSTLQSSVLLFPLRLPPVSILPLISLDQVQNLASASCHVKFLASIIHLLTFWVRLSKFAFHIVRKPWAVPVNLCKASLSSACKYFLNGLLGNIFCKSLESRQILSKADDPSYWSNWLYCFLNFPVLTPALQGTCCMYP